VAEIRLISTVNLITGMDRGRCVRATSARTRLVVEQIYVLPIYETFVRLDERCYGVDAQ